MRALAILVLAGVAVVLYAIAIERNWFALRRHTIECLPPGSRPLRVLHISDLHLRARQRRKQAFLRRLDRLAPDIVVGTGDFLGDQHSAYAAVGAVGAIRARIAALFVLGSNDYFAPVPKSPLRYFRKRKGPPTPGIPNPWPELVQGLEQQGWTLINNRALEVAGIEVLGLDDAHIGRADLSLASPRSDRRFRLVVAHSPDVAPPLANLGYDLILCGHTHGGQVCLPWVGALVTNSKLPARMARGVHRIGESMLHVCAGLGTSMYAPYRLFCRPEACLLELRPKPGHEEPMTASSSVAWADRPD